MEFNKQLIEIKDLPHLKLQLQEKVKIVDPLIERVRCIFGYKDDTSVYVYTAFDFLDNYDTIVNGAPLEKFYIYQLIEKKSIS